jgi:hypothetical protein
VKNHTQWAKRQFREMRLPAVGNLRYNFGSCKGKPLQGYLLCATTRKIPETNREAICFHRMDFPLEKQSTGLFFNSPFSELTSC